MLGYPRVIDHSGTRVLAQLGHCASLISLIPCFIKNGAELSKTINCCVSQKKPGEHLLGTRRRCRCASGAAASGAWWCRVPGCIGVRVHGAPWVGTRAPWLTGLASMAHWTGLTGLNDGLFWP